MATPAMDEASRCKEVILLYGGTVLTQGDPALLSNQVQGFVYEVVSPNPRQVAEELKVQYPHWSIQVFGDRLHVTVPEEEERANEEGDPIERIRAAIPAVAGKSSEDRGRLCRVRPIRPGLEDVFIALVSRNERETSNPTQEVQPMQKAIDSSIVVRHLYKRFGSFTAVDNLLFRYQEDRCSDSWVPTVRENPPRFGFFAGF